MNWPELYGRIVTETGWTYDYIRNELDWPDARDLIAYWDANPTTRDIVMALGKNFGLKRRTEVNSESLNDLASMPGVSFISKKNPQGAGPKTRPGAQTLPSKPPPQQGRR